MDYSIPERTYEYYNDIKLNPSIPARRNRSCKRFLLISVTIGLIAALFTSRLIFLNFYGIWEPHASLLYENNSTDPVDPASVVRPLIDEKQTFDIVATVWVVLRRSGTHEVWQKLHGTNVLSLPEERAIFTGTVFKGLRLKDKEIRAAVEYKVPTKIFKYNDLNEYDLRASFVLIPTSPSLLDNLTSYSSWRNDKIFFPPFRFRSETSPVPTLQDKAIDSFGATIGLLTFSGIQSRCATSTSNITSASDHSLSENDKNSDDKIDGGTANEKNSKPSESSSSRQPIENSVGKPVLESHPYIISRSFILAADRTKPYDREAYNRAHSELKNSICRLAVLPPLDWKFCNQRFEEHGNMGTRLQLSMAEAEDENRIREHLAYAPYLTFAKYAWTPKDLVPIPVNREDCTKGGRFNNSEPLLPDEEYVNITWEIVYSGQPPAQLTFSEAFRAVPIIYNMTDTKANQLAEQVKSEVTQGLRGHRLSEDRHPVRMVFIFALLGITHFVKTLLDLHYWYTRSSTVGISKFAVTLAAAANIGPVLLMAPFEDYNFFPFTLAMILPFLMMHFLKLKVVWRIKVGWGRGNGKGKRTEKEPKRWGWMCLPRLNLVKASHRERASDRLDRSTSWTVKFALFISCCLAHFFLSPDTSFLIPPRGLHITQSGELGDILVRSIIYPGSTIGAVLQLWFNRKSHTFAGQYKLSVIFQGVWIALNMSKMSTRLLGNIDVREGFSVDDLIDLILAVVWCWQAVMLPKVSQGEIDDESE